MYLSLSLIRTLWYTMYLSLSLIRTLWYKIVALNRTHTKLTKVAVVHVVV